MTALLSRWPARLLSVLPLLALAVFAPAAARAEDEPTATLPDLALWSDQAHLEKELALALDVVAAVEGKAFKRKPTIRTTDAEAMRDILVAEVGETLERLGNSKEATRHALGLFARALVMKYEPEKDVIHVMPENVQRIVELLGKPELASKELLRITLIHEAAHGLDFQHYPHLDEQRRGRKTAEGIQAIGAIVEGHAQFVAARAAKKLGLEAAFGQLVDLTVSAPPAPDAATKIMMDVLVAEQRFAYVGGHKFLEAVFAARGADGVEKVLREPPESVRSIEQPEVYLDPSKAGSAIDPEAVAAPLLAWSEKAGRTLQEFPFKRSQMDAVFTLIPADKTKPMREAFKQGWGVASLRTSQADMVVGILLEFRTEAGARAYLEQAEALLKKKDEVLKTGAVRILEAKYEKGAGPDGSVPGFVCTKKMSVNGTEASIVTHNILLGRFAVDITCLDGTVDRKTQDRLVGETAAALRAQIGQPVKSGASDESKQLLHLVRAFQKAQDENDEEALLVLGAQIVPTSAELKAICRPGDPADAFLAAYGGPRDLSAENVREAGALKLLARSFFSPRDENQTEVQVHAATSEEIARYEEGGAAHAEFPGGMRKFAALFAAPGRTWYVVELLEPGKDLGMKYTCFTRIGDRFVAVLKPWRAVPPSDGR